MYIHCNDGEETTLRYRPPPMGIYRRRSMFAVFFSPAMNMVRTNVSLHPVHEKTDLNAAAEKGSPERLIHYYRLYFCVFAPQRRAVIERNANSFIRPTRRRTIFVTQGHRIGIFNTLTDTWHFFKFPIPSIRTHFSITAMAVMKLLLL